jgi:hypothetical protein
MKQSMFMEKYPVFSLEISKGETQKSSAEEIAKFFEEKVTNHPKAVMVGTFDHYAHTKSLGGEIHGDIQAAINVVFCFGFVLPNPQMMAVRPRSIAIVDLGNHFLITFMEAPMKTANDTMETWARELVNKI